MPDEREQGRHPPTTGSGVKLPGASEDRAAIELAYGWLWYCKCDRSTADGIRIYEARQALLARLDPAARIRGIMGAAAVMPIPGGC